MRWWQFCERARCFPDTALRLFTPKQLAERYARYNPDAEPMTARDILLLFQDDC